MAERRKLTRFAVSARARLILGDEGAPEQIETRVRDLSAGGAYIYLDDSGLDVGQHVKVEIRLPVPDDQRPDDLTSRAPMVGMGEVRRVDSVGLALAFDRRLRFV